MKITGPGSVTQNRKTERKKAVGGEDFGAFLDRAGETEGAQASAPVIPAAFVPLFEAQDDDTGGKAAKQGKELLDALEKLRMGLLTGRMPKAELENLGRMMKSARATTSDPQLAEVLNEIEVRAAVELAKLEVQE